MTSVGWGIKYRWMGWWFQRCCFLCDWFKECSTAQLGSSVKLLNLPALLYSSISTGYQSAAGFSTKELSPAFSLSLAQLFHISLSSFVSALLFALFALVLFRRWASDLWSGTLFLSLSVKHFSSLSTFKSNLKTYLFSSAHWFVVLSSLFLPKHHQ